MSPPPATASAKPVDVYFELMRVLVEDRHHKQLHHRLSKLAEHSKLHIDTLVLIHHLATIAPGSILEVNPRGIATTVAALLGLRDLPVEKKLISLKRGTFVGRTLFRATLWYQLRKAAAPPNLVDRLVESAAAERLGLVVCGRAADVTDAIRTHAARMRERCWILVDDYSRGAGRPGTTRNAVDHFLAEGIFMPVGLFGAGTWAGQFCAGR